MKILLHASRCLIAVAMVVSTAAAGNLGLPGGKFTPISLVGHYNFSLTNSLLNPGGINGANHLGEFPAGRSAFGTVPFEVGGVAQLSSRQSVMAGRKFPEKIEGVKIGASCAAFHLLHGAGWFDVDGAKVASILLHYSDGKNQEVPIIYGQHVRDWWIGDEPPLDKLTQVAWKGRNPVAKAFGSELHVYLTSFLNPRPGVVIDKIDFISAKADSATFVLGLTTE